MDLLITWLFLNARQQRDEQAMSALGNSSNTTPSTNQVKRITDMIEEILVQLADSENNEQLVKIALHSLTNVVKKMNKTILELAQNQSIGFDMSVKLSQRTNEYFIKFLKQWLVSDAVASYFVFDLEGFEFLLDTIGIGQSTSITDITGKASRKVSLDISHEVDLDDFIVKPKEEEKVSSSQYQSALINIAA